MYRWIWIINIDFIRCLCTFLVILAHVNPPHILNEIRTFDVVSLTFISGISLHYSKYPGYYSFIKNKIKKLLIPTYITITIIFVFSFLYCDIFLNGNQLFDSFTIIKSYFFYGGIGFVWVLKIYLSISLCFPLIDKISIFFKKRLNFFIFVIFLYCFYLLILYFFINNEFVYQYFLQVFPFVLIALIGYKTFNDKNALKIIKLISMFLVIAFVFYKKSFIPSFYKYPPRLFYISYGLLITTILLQINIKHLNSFFVWVSRNSFNLYLFHILYLFFFNAIEDINFLNFVSIWYIKYTFIIVLSCLSVYLLKKIIFKFKQN